MIGLLHDYFMFGCGAVVGGGLFYGMTASDWLDWLERRARAYMDWFE